MAGLGRGRGESQLYYQLRQVARNSDIPVLFESSELLVEKVADFYQGTYKYITEFSNSNNETRYLLSEGAVKPGFGVLINPDTMNVLTRIFITKHNSDPSNEVLVTPFIVDWTYKGTTFNFLDRPWTVSAKITCETLPSAGPAYFVSKHSNQVVKCRVADRHDIPWYDFNSQLMEFVLTWTAFKFGVSLTKYRISVEFALTLTAFKFCLPLAKYKWVWSIMSYNSRRDFLYQCVSMYVFCPNVIFC